MDDTDRAELRRLATWLSRRRDVDEAVALLTAYGPAASERVSTHLDALKQLLAAEREAFAAVEASSPRLPQSPLPLTRDLSASPDATVHSLVRARSRSRE